MAEPRERLPPRPATSRKDRIVIRRGHPSDREALVALLRRAALANPGDRAQLLEHPDAMDLPREHLSGNRVLVARVDGRLVGFATVLPGPDGEAELDALFVEPHAWRTGIGTALAHACQAQAARGGAQVLRVIANPHAQAFYDACGFVPCGIRAMPLGNGLLMRKTLR